MGYLKNRNKMRLIFDSINPTVKESWFKEYDLFNWYQDSEKANPPNTPEGRGNFDTMSCFLDTNHSGNKVYRSIQTGILIFINRTPINCYSKKQPPFEASTFGAEFCVMKVGVEMIEGLRYKLSIFGVTIHGSEKLYCKNEAV